MALLSRCRSSLERVNVRYDILGSHVWLNDQPILGVFQVFRARAANEAVSAIRRSETITTVRLIIFSEVPLPVTDRVRGLTHPRVTESQVRLGLALEVSVEKLVGDQHPMLAV